MENDIEIICEKLDSMILRSLELIEEKVMSTVQLENHLRDGNMEMAKSRYIQGRETVGILRVPQDKTINSLFELETTYTDEKIGSNSVPQFDIQLKEQKIIEVNNPLRWFGVLVPQCLRTAQRKFQESLYLTVKLANIGAELENIFAEIESTKKSKNILKNESEE